jgi:saxitoxin biosynthesis operon SxtJ-like protein
MIEKSTTELTANEKDLKNFGFIMGGFILIIFGVIPLFFFKVKLIIPWLISICFILASLIKPLALKSIYKVWMKFGYVMHSITTPILLGIVYYFVLTPIGLIKRIFDKDAMGLDFQSDKMTYRKKSQIRARNSIERPF